eukprot:TRINITY_DN2512_c2_g1_i2.p1 TRINITY_DN2512_c2_g1~~TRINITY_DN2512_c2_g1_i2.p1  ORF type:complete len:708 (+),score=177.81 TRINITY_DN2512_c2_g1_i2:252-2375(+)
MDKGENTFFHGFCPRHAGLMENPEALEARGASDSFEECIEQLTPILGSSSRRFSDDARSSGADSLRPQTEYRHLEESMQAMRVHATPGELIPDGSAIPSYWEPADGRVEPLAGISGHDEHPIDCRFFSISTSQSSSPDLAHHSTQAFDGDSHYPAILMGSSEAMGSSDDFSMRSDDAGHFAESKDFLVGCQEMNYDPDEAFYFSTTLCEKDIIPLSSEVPRILEEQKQTSSETSEKEDEVEVTPRLQLTDSWTGQVEGGILMPQFPAMTRTGYDHADVDGREMKCLSYDSAEFQDVPSTRHTQSIPHFDLGDLGDLGDDDDLDTRRVREPDIVPHVEKTAESVSFVDTLPIRLHPVTTVSPCCPMQSVTCYTHGVSWEKGEDAEKDQDEYEDKEKDKMEMDDEEKYASGSCAHPTIDPRILSMENVTRKGSHIKKLTFHHFQMQTPPCDPANPTQKCHFSGPGGKKRIEKGCVQERSASWKKVMEKSCPSKPSHCWTFNQFLSPPKKRKIVDGSPYCKVSLLSHGDVECAKEHPEADFYFRLKIVDRITGKRQKKMNPSCIVKRQGLLLKFSSVLYLRNSMRVSSIHGKWMLMRIAKPVPSQKMEEHTCSPSGSDTSEQIMCTGVFEKLENPTHSKSPRKGYDFIHVVHEADMPEVAQIRKTPKKWFKICVKTVVLFDDGTSTTAKAQSKEFEIGSKASQFCSSSQP